MEGGGRQERVEKRYWTFGGSAGVWVRVEEGAFCPLDWTFPFLLWIHNVEGNIIWTVLTWH